MGSSASSNSTINSRLSRRRLIAGASASAALNASACLPISLVLDIKEVLRHLGKGQRRHYPCSQPRHPRTRHQWWAARVPDSGGPDAGTKDWAVVPPRGRDCSPAPEFTPVWCSTRMAPAEPHSLSSESAGVIDAACRSDM